MNYLLVVQVCVRLLEGGASVWKQQKGELTYKQAQERYGKRSDRSQA